MTISRSNNSPLRILDNAEHWRLRASEARAIAGSIEDADAREALLEIAKSYDEVAKIAEERFRSLVKP